MKKNTKKVVSKGMSTGKKVAIGGAIAAIGAGAYYLLGPDAKAHQKKTSVLLAKVKKEVQSEAKKVKEMSGPLYQKAVDVISTNYAKQYKAHGKEIKAFADKLKKEYKKITK